MTKSIFLYGDRESLGACSLMSSRQITVAPLDLPDIKTAR
jgi:hypothetical protein